MRIIHVLRKPLSEGTVASNVLKHGCGGLNIDASRIGTGEDKGVWPQTDRQRNILRNPANKNSLGKAVVTDTTVGRWPANVVLQHLEGCRCEGTKRVKAAQGGRNPVRRTAIHGEYGGHQSVGRSQSYCDYADKDGKETVSNWICEPGCPVARLDEQSGVRPSTLTGRASPSTSHKHPSTSTTDNRVAMKGGLTQPGGQVYADTGGASRFYKHVGGSK